MSEHEKADQARKGLIDSIKGKVKEFAGAVTRNDSLTTEGQLDQVQAQERKRANSIDAVAKAEAEQANADAAEAKLEGTQERIAVSAETAAVENSIATQQAAQKQAAEQAAKQDAARGAIQAELDAQGKVVRAKSEARQQVNTAAEDLVDAVDEHQASVQDARKAQTEADRIRRHADNLTEEADLP
jgi:uncharacterized protein YjbJ (UPF0337 family)